MSDLDKEENNFLRNLTLTLFGIAFSGVVALLGWLYITVARHGGM